MDEQLRIVRAMAVAHLREVAGNYDDQSVGRLAALEALTAIERAEVLEKVNAALMDLAKGVHGLLVDVGETCGPRGALTLLLQAYAEARAKVGSASLPMVERSAEAENGFSLRATTDEEQWTRPLESESPVVEKPPLGMVPYLPSHNHSEAEICGGPEWCPYAQWERHKERFGDPYPVVARDPGPMRGTPWNDRGFLGWPDIETDYGHVVSVQESSVADRARVWMHVETEKAKTEPKMTEPIGVHMTLDQATRLRDDLTQVIENHYQVRS